MHTTIRLLTAIAMIGVCGILVAQGWSIVHVSLAMADVEMPAIDSAKKRADVIKEWTGVPGLASIVLRAELADERNPEPKLANRRREALSAILLNEPLSSMDWLSLSRAQLVTGQPIKQVVGSFRLSVLTGPNEANVMVERALFGISIWDSLPQDLKSHVAVDFGPIISPRAPMDGGRVRAVIFAESDRVRNELREALLPTGVSRQKIKQQLGF